MSGQNNRRFTTIAAILIVTCIVSLPTRANIQLRMQTSIGSAYIELFDAIAPQTVTNFMNYVNDGDYDGTFIHRNVPGLVVQGGGYIFDGAPGSFFAGGVSEIPRDPPVMNEFSLSNVRGTLAMATLANMPDSGTSEWFVNLTDNSAENDPDLYTVFGQVNDEEMELFDTITDLLRCGDILPAFVCGQFAETPFAELTAEVTNDSLVVLNHIGFDNDDDGVIDSLEDGSGNGGDGNNDAVADSEQDNVASFPGSDGEYLTVEVPLPDSLSSFDILGKAFVFVHPASTGILTDLDFQHGYIGYDLPGIAGPGSVEVVTVTLPADAAPDTFFNFGPTPGNAESDWYEFLYDGMTGAEINGNVLTLHYIDGMRGDADLQQNGIIKVSPGGAATRFGDGDGIPDEVEDAGPNNGDGNNDGVADSVQGNVASFTDLDGNYVTLFCDPAFKLQALLFRQITAGFVDPDNPPVVTPDINTAEPPGILKGFNLSHDLMEFEVANLTPGDTIMVTLRLPEGERPKKYFKFGPTTDNPDDHWYDFSFDGETGVEINGNVIILHFVDGKRGDSDLEANGIISDPGAPAMTAENSTANDGGGGGGGCSLVDTPHSGASRAGAWYLLLALLSIQGLLLAMRRRLRGPGR